MAMSFSHMLLRLASAVWLAACFGVLVFGYANRAVHDMPVAMFWLIGLLSFPIGTGAMVAVGVATGGISMLFAIPYHPFWDELAPWLAAVLAGYWQWFVYVPRQVREYKTQGVQ